MNGNGTSESSSSASMSVDGGDHRDQHAVRTYTLFLSYLPIIILEYDRPSMK